MTVDEQPLAAEEDSAAAGPHAAGPIDPAWAWARYQPDEKRPWTAALAGHLYRRAAFGARQGELERALAEGPQRTVDALLAGAGDPEAFERSYTDYEREAASKVESLRAWWLRRMIDTPHPLLEQMTLFWHNHFAASAARVESGPLMLAHVQRLRRGALGRFDELLAEMALDPALLLTLGAAQNRKSDPNLRFAQQWLAGLTVGPGNFSEQDVAEVARAWTGWFVYRTRLRFVEREHDSGEKTILGHRGAFGAKEVVPVVLDQPGTARTIVRKLYRWFVSQSAVPGDALIEPLVAGFAKDYRVDSLLERMLRSNLFFSPLAYRQRIKSPVDYALGIIRPLEGMVATEALGQRLASMGQALYQPPTSHGWAGGKHWLNPLTVTARSNLALQLLSGTKPFGGKLDPAALAKRHGHAELASASPFFVALFLQSDVGAKTAAALKTAAADAQGTDRQRLLRLVHAVVTVPEFQLA